MSIQVDILKEKRIVKVTLEGYSSVEATREVLLNYSSYIKEINPRGYALLIDFTNHGHFVQEAQMLVLSLIRLNIGTGYRRIVFVRSASKVENLQIERIMELAGGNAGVMVDSLSEAMTLCET